MRRTLKGWLLKNLPLLRPVGGYGIDILAALTRQDLGVGNPRFVPPYIEQAGVKELKVAQHWCVRWESGVHADEGYLVRPECYLKNLGPVWNPTADQAQGIQSTYATHNAAFVQCLPAPIGAINIRVEAQVAYYAPGSGAAATIGLDPTGQTNSIKADTINWADHWLDQDGGWQPETWGTIAHSVPISLTGELSIWLRSTNRWRARNTHFWWYQVIGTYETEDAPTTDLQEVLDRLEDIYKLLEAVHDIVATPPAYSVRAAKALKEVMNHA